MALHTRGIADCAAQFLQKEQLKDRALWKKFVDVFRSQPDSDNRGWRGEYWGKMMRGGVLVYGYTKDRELYEILTESVRDMLTTAEPNGRVSSYKQNKEFIAWDLWCRKYVILGCEYYLEICKDDALKKEIVLFIRGCADYILECIGEREDQKNITDTSKFWYGMNSSSILEPIVKLYRLTNEKKYLDFATYIVKQGGVRGINIFKLAYENKLYPYQYGISKAYEMISCFEGLLEYYYATGNEKCKTAVINFANALMDTEISIIGGSGITNELFDYTKARQTVRQDDVLHETCVTVTWMKFCASLLDLTGDSRFADCMERSFYNAYLGTFNTDHKICAYMRRTYFERTGKEDIIDTFLPVDSYSPLLSGKRGEVVGGSQILPDLSYYGCCACIASAGVGVFMQQMVIVDESGITVNFFENGSATVQYDGIPIEIEQKTEYPISGKIEITVHSKIPKEFQLKVRIPAWTGSKEGYAVYKKEWSDDTIVLDYPMNLRTQLPMAWEKEVVYTDTSKIIDGNFVASPATVYHDPDDDHYIALMRGPITLAADSRSGKKANSVFDFEPQGEFCEDKEIAKGIPCLLKMRFVDKNGEEFYLVDYSSAGKDWQTEIAAWLRTK